MNEQHEIGTVELTGWFCGGGGSAEREWIAAHVSGCLLCRNRLEALRREKEHFLRSAPLAPAVALETAPVARLRVSWRPLYAAAAVLAVALGAGIAFRPQRQGDTARIKGPVAVHMFVQADSGAVKRPESVYYPGERVQLTYSCGAENRLVLLSIDQTGAITIYYPAQGDTSIALEPGQDRPLPNSIELDSYTGPELFVAWFTGTAATVAAVRAAVADAFATEGALDRMSIRPPDGAVVRTMLITKQERP